MRTKIQQPVATADLKSAWQAVFDKEKTEDFDEMIEAGWLTIEMAADGMGLSHSGARKKLETMLKHGELETCVRRVPKDNVVRAIRFYRPVI